MFRVFLISLFISFFNMSDSDTSETSFEIVRAAGSLPMRIVELSAGLSRSLIERSAPDDSDERLGEDGLTPETSEEELQNQIRRDAVLVNKNISQGRSVCRPTLAIRTQNWHFSIQTEAMRLSDELVYCFFLSVLYYHGSSRRPTTFHSRVVKTYCYGSFWRPSSLFGIGLSVRKCRASLTMEGLDRWILLFFWDGEGYTLKIFSSQLNCLCSMNSIPRKTLGSPSNHRCF